MLDMTRILVYIIVLVIAGGENPIGSMEWPPILVGIGAALAGVLADRTFLHKVTMKAVQTITGILLTGIALTWVPE
jgi:hypothetical protein